MRIRAEDVVPGFWKKVGRRISEMRKQRGFSQEQLAERVATEPKNMGQIERGEHGSSVILLLSISNTLNVPLDYLLTGTQRPPEAEKITDRETLQKIIAYLTPCNELELRAAYDILRSTLPFVRGGYSTFYKEGDLLEDCNL